MASTTTRNMMITLVGDINENFQVNAASNTGIRTQAYFVGVAATPVLVFQGPTTVFSCMTIVPATSNTSPLVIRGNPGDTGIILHKTDPAHIAIDSTTQNIYLSSSVTATAELIFS